MYDVEAYSPEISKAYGRLFVGPDEDKSSELLDWRFLNNPHGKGFFATARDEGEIVGLIGLVPSSFIAPRGRTVGLHAIDTIVSPDYRGRGLFTGMGNAIYTHADKHGADYVWGFPNDKAAGGWFGKLGWKKFGTVPFLIKPLKSALIFRRISEKLGFINFPLAFGKAQEPEGFRELSELNSQVSDLFEEFCEESHFIRDRSASWLTWRLFEAPLNDYRCVGIFRNGRCAAFVATATLDKHDTKVCYIMEAAARNEDNKALEALLTYELRLARNRGAEVSLAWCTDQAVNRSVFRRSGFRFFPDRWRPVDLFFGGRDISECGNFSARLEDWYISYLDSDTV
ncbi:GNAT family N-acetyltransferase [Altererythrobacter luteolus]|uniref:GNAT family N-acetyltransferase n=1 Tax=Pontixanthobacter luteolus TaxID=295089 RepID=A0A6I4V2D2_9SPHN|nr:GNAT family N-acetyltransferase [Pontixanthobacter luteolus]MXP47948.1 GNAT family N-acetyltransferase [Pontixanthobacter luteolus]